MTIQQICQLSEEVRTGELLEAVFIDQAIKDPDSKEADASFVLCATYPTIPLRGLVELMAQKLSGEHPKGTVVIRGDYGSGKSHALLALYQKGATLGVVYALIAGEVILGSLERDIMEFRFFGGRSYVLRLVLCTVFVILTGFALEVLT